jgi:hypothetical protein
MAKKTVETPKPKLFEPWVPPLLDLPELAALQAVAKGTATADQQMRAMRVIVERCGWAYEDTWCPGVNGERDSNFAMGRRRVGTMLVSFLNANLDNFRSPDAAPTEQPNRRL